MEISSESSSTEGRNAFSFLFLYSIFRFAKECTTEEDIDSLIDNGHAITSLVSSAHSAFGALVLIVYAIYLFFASIGLYNGSALLNVVNGVTR